jgi:poly(hydroxyalkanoate) depolymerase family esterase
LKHDGGGDPHAVAQMVRYALKKYKGDSTRVYALGGSSGGMMTQALAAIYPEMFTAVTPRAGVPCGCWAVSFKSDKQWSDPCAGGTVTKTAKEWGDIVRAINPNYTGHRPRVQIMQGDADATISYKNMAEGIKQWTNVLDLKTDPDSTAKITSNETGTNYTYNCKFWKNKCGYVVLESWFAVGGSHSMNYEETAILKFFGLDVAGGPDPELAKCNVGTIKQNLERTLSSSTLCTYPADLTIYTLNGKMVKVLNSLNKTQSLRDLQPGMVYLVSDKLSGKARLMVMPK